jgi:hypothetical protein
MLMLVAVVVVPVVVIVMIVLVTMVMVVIVAMTMMRMSMVVVVIVSMVVVTMPTFGISATFGIETGLDHPQFRAKALQHILDHMVAAEADAVAGDLGWQMAVADMPGEAQQILRGCSTDFDECLGRSDDFNKSAIIKHERITAAQCDDVIKIEQEIEPARPGHADAAAVAVVEIENNRISRFNRPASGGLHGKCAQHLKSSHGPDGSGQGACRTSRQERIFRAAASASSTGAFAPNMRLAAQSPSMRKKIWRAADSGSATPCRRA